MRPYALALAVTAAVLAVPAGPAHAVLRCAAVAVPAHYNPTTYVIDADGTFACTDAVAGLTVTVCLEEQLGGALGGSWYSHGCTTVTSQQSTRSVSATTSTQVPLYGTFFRTVVTGTDADGDTGSAKSAPTPWVNCACLP